MCFVTWICEQRNYAICFRSNYKMSNCCTIRFEVKMDAFAISDRWNRFVIYSIKTKNSIKTQQQRYFFYFDLVWNNFLKKIGTKKSEENWTRGSKTAFVNCCLTELILNRTFRLVSIRWTRFRVDQQPLRAIVERIQCQIEKQRNNVQNTYDHTFFLYIAHWNDSVCALCAHIKLKTSFAIVLISCYKIALNDLSWCENVCKI